MSCHWLGLRSGTGIVETPAFVAFSISLAAKAPSILAAIASGLRTGTGTRPFGASDTVNAASLAGASTPPVEIGTGAPTTRAESNGELITMSAGMRSTRWLAAVSLQIF
jgi:hypothetical protein